MSTYHTVDELDVAWALRVAVASSVLGTGLVGWESGETTIGVHLGEVKGAVQTAGKVGNVDVKGKLLIEKLEHLIGRLAGHQVNAGTDVLLGGIRDEFEGECVTASGDTVGARVVCTVESAVLRASSTIGTKRAVPGVAGVAVG